MNGPTTPVGEERPHLAVVDANGATGPANDGETPSTWDAIDLGPLLDGGDLDDPPGLLARTDGPRLLYPGKLHALSGEPEAGKGWLALAAIAERLAAGDHALYIDFEDTPATIIGRLIALGVERDLVAHGLSYLRPDEPLDTRGRQGVAAALEHNPALAIIDGVTEALAIHGLDLGDNSDVAQWLTLLPRPLATAGAAVVLIDHVVKDKEARGRYAIGAQHKLAGVDVAYTLTTIEPFARGRDGLAKLVVTKDRPGHIRQHSEHGHIANVALHSGPDGAVTLELRAPDQPSAPFRPTGYMERVSLALEATPGLTANGIREAVPGKHNAKKLAVEILVGDGHIRVERDGQARHHHIVRPYRETDDRAPAPQPRPDHAPAQAETGAPATGPIGAGAEGRGSEGPANPHDHAPTERLIP